MMAAMLTRTPSQVIDQAVAENRTGERLLYGLAFGVAVVGLSVLIWAAVNRLSVIAIAGGIATSFFWPAVKSARQTRKESIAIRLLEAPLSRADTAREAAAMLTVIFNRLMLEEQTERIAKVEGEQLATKPTE
jgi:hypothetical protein